MSSRYGFTFNETLQVCEKAGYKLLKSVFTPSIYWSDFAGGEDFLSGEHPGWDFDGLYQVNKHDFVHYGAVYFAEHTDHDWVETLGLLNREQAIKWWQHMDEWNFHLTHNKDQRRCRDIGFDQAFGLEGQT